ncbi:transposase [Melghirimyces profundicolus]|uniref:Transposase n=1 Tax=Melghirimyces profundicolus TaxID=1242148 RepID=A0A2T6AQZ2_9BACL|nr:IS5 family transposase [Melghirimyces profundicolus]PTX46217.1 transposase [Melghirimyces profundicolus]
MLGKQSPQNALFQYVNLEDLIPENHLLRRIDRALDLSFLRPMVEPLYVSEGRPSIDPEVAFRAMLLGYLFNLNDHRLHQELTMHAGYRWFCRLDFNDPVPDRSTLIKTRERWAKAGLLDSILAQIVQQCIERGLVQGDTLAIDGTQIPARAAVNSLERIGTVLQMEESDSDEDDDEPPSSPPRQAGNPDFHGERFSNATHRSKTDPDARLYRKGKGKETRLSYLGHYVADVPSGVILAAEATLATGDAETQVGRRLLAQVQQQLPHPSQRRKLAADKGYAEKNFLKETIELGFDPHIALQKEEEEPIPTWKRRTFSLDRLRRRKLKVQWAKARNTVRQLNRQPITAYVRHLRKRIEHLFAEGKEWHGLDRARGRRLWRIQIQTRMTAITQNLKRMAHFLHRHSPAGEGAGWFNMTGQSLWPPNQLSVSFQRAEI